MKIFVCLVSTDKKLPKINGFKMNTWTHDLPCGCLSAPFPKHSSVLLMNKGGMVTLIKAKYRLNNMDLNLTKMVTHLPMCNSQQAILKSELPLRWYQQHYDFIWPYSVMKGIIICPHKNTGILDLNFSYIPSFSFKQHHPWTYWTLYTITKHRNPCRNYLYS